MKQERKMSVKPRSRAVSSVSDGRNRSTSNASNLGSTYSLTVHTASHSTEEIILNQDVFKDFVSIGDFVKVFEPSRPDESIVLKVASMQQSAGRYEISISKTVADVVNLKSFVRVEVEKICDEKTVWLDFVEVAFKKQYLQRGNMWRCRKMLFGRSVHLGQNLSINEMQLQIQELRIESSKQKSGIITENTKFVFRSRSCRIGWLIQITAEMWDYDQNG